MAKKIVIKIGGSNQKNARDYQRISCIVEAYSQPLVIVVSAYFGLTNKLIRILEQTTHDKNQIEKFTNKLLAHNRQLVNNNIPDGNFQKATYRKLETRINQLHKILISIHYIGEVPKFLYDKVLSYGERLSILLASRILTTKGINSEEILPEDLNLTTDGIQGFASWDFELSTSTVQAKLSGDKTYVVPGFYGISQQGKVTLFGRGGNDYTAASLAKYIGAEYLDIWKDVDGFLSADPGIISNPYNISRLSYNEAAELVYFGAHILHPETISPIKTKNISLRILNINEFSGSIVPSSIVNGSSDIHPGIIKSITYSDDFGILQLNEAGVGAKTGILAEVTQRLESKRVNIKSVITSQIIINILLSKTDLERPRKNILKNPLRMIKQVQLETDISVIAVVGRGLLTEQAGVTRRILGAIAS